MTELNLLNLEMTLLNLKFDRAFLSNPRASWPRPWLLEGRPYTPQAGVAPPPKGGPYEARLEETVKVKRAVSYASLRTLLLVLCSKPVSVRA